MVDAFTSIKTTGGWADQAAASVAYDLLFRWELRNHPISRQFADVRPADVKHQAKSYRIFKNQDFAESTVDAALTPLDEETDVSATKLPTPTYVDLTPTEYGFGTLRTLRLKNRSLVEVDPVIANAVAYHMVRVVDKKVQSVLGAGTNQVYAGSGNAAANDIAAGDSLKGANVRQIVTRLRSGSVQPRDGQFFVGVIHPHTEMELREESGSLGWREAQVYGTSQTRLYTGEIGEYEGARFVVNPRTTVTDNATAVPVYKSYFMGREALAEAVNIEPNIVIGPVTDRLYRFRSVGWLADADWGVFRQEALIVANSTLTAANATALGV